MPVITIASGIPDICDRHEEISRFLNLPLPECRIDIIRIPEGDGQSQVKIRGSPVPEVGFFLLS